MNEERIKQVLAKAIQDLHEQNRELAYLRAELFKLRLQVSELTDFKNKIVK